MISIAIDLSTEDTIMKEEQVHSSGIVVLIDPHSALSKTPFQ